MPYEAFVEYRPHRATLDLIEKANRIIDEYVPRGLRLTVRVISDKSPAFHAFDGKREFDFVRMPWGARPRAMISYSNFGSDDGGDANKIVSFPKTPEER